MSKATNADVASVVETIAVAFNKNGDAIDVAKTLLNVGKDTIESKCSIDVSIPRLHHLGMAIHQAWSEASKAYNAGGMRGSFADRIQQLHMFEIDTSLTPNFTPPLLNPQEEIVLNQARSITWVWRTTDIEAELVSELLCTVSLGFVTHTKIITPQANRSADMANALTAALGELLARVDIVEAVAYPKVGANGLRVSTKEVLDNALAIGYDFSVHGDATIVTCNIDFPLWGQSRAERAEGLVIDRQHYMTLALASTLDALVFDFAEGAADVQRSLKAIRAVREARPVLLK
jgi:hypothetical protein